MDREQLLQSEPELLKLFRELQQLHERLGSGFRDELQRTVSYGDTIVDRWEKGRQLGFGKNTNVYDNALIIGDVHVGDECWIGPQTILDGSGGLVIGDYCTISAGVQIYSHDNVQQTLSSKQLPIERKAVRIGNNVYVAPNAVITKGVTIGSNVVVGAFAFVNKDVPDNSVVFGQPAKQVGTLIPKDEGAGFSIQYSK
jgi:acetyltransferase-like isoleucine patch superfamily enzyme